MPQVAVRTTSGYHARVVILQVSFVYAPFVIP